MEDIRVNVEGGVTPPFEKTDLGSMASALAEAAIKNCRAICMTVAVSIMSVSVCSCTAICVKSKMKAEEARYNYLAEELKQKDK